MKKIVVLGFCFCLLLPLVAQTVTPNIGLNVPRRGTTNWDTLVNQNFTTLDLMLSGHQSIPAIQATRWIAPGSSTVANLPVLAPTFAIAGVTDGASTTDCTSGHGIYKNVCFFNGIGWQVFVTGLGVNCSSLPGLTGDISNVNCAMTVSALRGATLPVLSGQTGYLYDNNGTLQLNPSGSSGTVNSGQGYALAYYAGNGTSVSQIPGGLVQIWQFVPDVF